ncbi:putative short-chain dehydrogenase/reductase [Tricladium varicosporioides]|nr:putative short-chain dehydrogenase/reductase [Hymenoscyphus varicosporioides]
MSRKTVLITGSSEGGIGDSLAKTFHAKGLRVFATARNLKKVEHLKSLGIEVLELDVVDSESIKRTVETITSLTGGTLDILVNNSGSGYNLPLLDSDINIAKNMFNVNVFAVIEVTKAFAPLLIASKGTIVNIGSIVGYFPFPWQGYYNASKAAVNLLTDQLRIELSPFGVKAINVVTGVVRTKFFENIATPPHLPANSLYMPAKEEMEDVMANTEVKNDAIDVDVYAEQVVSNVLKSNPKKIHWVGGNSFMIWFVSTFGWATIWDYALAGPAKLGLVTRKVQAAQKSR